MRHAAALLRRDRDASIGGIGYASEAAFSHAFKRVIGEPPRRFRKREAQQLAAQ